MNDYEKEQHDMIAVHGERTFPDRDELNISAATAELLELIDEVEDGDVLAKALEAAMLALVDITGDDPNRATIASPGKLARRVIARVTDILETDE